MPIRPVINVIDAWRKQSSEKNSRTHSNLHLNNEYNSSGLKEAIGCSETSVTTYKFTQHRNPEDHDSLFTAVSCEIEARKCYWTQPITKITSSTHSTNRKY